MTKFRSESLTLNTDTKIPFIGFGTYLIPSDEAAAAVRTAIDVGYRHIDTAEFYHNEESVGEGIRAALKDISLSREDIFVTTKLWPGNPEWDMPAKTQEQTLVAARASLARLGLDYVDLYLIHSPHGGAERLGQWKALLELRNSKKARAIGVSNYNIAHLEEIRNAGLPMPDANQIELHPWSQKTELIAYMRAHQIAPIAYSSLAPLSTWRTAPDHHSAKTGEMRETDTTLTRIAVKHGVSEAQLLLRWGMQNGYPVLPKSTKRERMISNFDLDGFSLDEADMAEIRGLDRGDGLAWTGGDPTRAV
ncbi:aldo/keto reductase [Cupriavidus plantarum]|uniref:aldo/keto reductase n=1 Tax=Cupriavidus plantarum TaxID=942865 RepID=UPI0015C9AD62|nr:aldo/keto reductase [Cupriavidus plantarum]NYI02754.1 2,5-diketo-D-gluconate reductase A [Cupriavidus plantarum]